MEMYLSVLHLKMASGGFILWEPWTYVQNYVNYASIIGFAIMHTLTEALQLKEISPSRLVTVKKDLFAIVLSILLDACNFKMYLCSFGSVCGIRKVALASPALRSVRFEVLFSFLSNYKRAPILVWCPCPFPLWWRHSSVKRFHCFGSF